MDSLLVLDQPGRSVQEDTTGCQDTGLLIEAREPVPATGGQGPPDLQAEIAQVRQAQRPTRERNLMWCLAIMVRPPAIRDHAALQWTHRPEFGA